MTVELSVYLCGNFPTQHKGTRNHYIQSLFSKGCSTAVVGAFVLRGIVKRVAQTSELPTAC